MEHCKVGLYPARIRAKEMLTLLWGDSADVGCLISLRRLLHSKNMQMPQCKATAFIFATQRFIITKGSKILLFLKVSANWSWYSQLPTSLRQQHPFFHLPSSTMGRGSWQASCCHFSSAEIWSLTLEKTEQILWLGGCHFIPFRVKHTRHLPAELLWPKHHYNYLKQPNIS